MGNWNPNYFEKKAGSLEEAILNAVNGKINEKLDPVNKSAAKKKFDDRKDKDIDNDGDVDSSDKYLHKRRKAIGKAMQSEGVPNELDESEGQPVPRDKDGKLVVKPGFKRVLSPGKGYIYKRDTGKPVTVGNRGMSGRDNTGGIGVRENASSPPGSMDFQRYIQSLKQKYKELYNNPPETSNDDVLDRYDEQLHNLQNRFDNAVEKAKVASIPSTKRES